MKTIELSTGTLLVVGVIGYDTSHQPIIPVRDKLVVKKNAHPNCDGTSWGWIEGCSLNICWSDENSCFSRRKADELVRQYNANLLPSGFQLLGHPSEITGDVWGKVVETELNSGYSDYSRPYPSAYTKSATASGLSLCAANSIKETDVLLFKPNPA